MTQCQYAESALTPELFLNNIVKTLLSFNQNGVEADMLL